MITKTVAGTEDQQEIRITHTMDKKEATNADTPATMVMARARLEPVPPAAVVMTEILGTRRVQGPRFVCDDIPTHAAESIEGQNMMLRSEMGEDQACGAKLRNEESCCPMTIFS
jgi:hypothetical protein